MALAINIEDLLDKQKIESNTIEFKKQKEEYDWKYRHIGKRTLQASQGGWLG